MYQEDPSKVESRQVVERCQTDLGELVLRRHGEHYELISDGMFLMDTRDGQSERTLINEALALAPPRPHVVIGGLGFGFSLTAAVASPVPAEITVVEIHRAVIEWNRKYLPERTADALADDRVTVVHDDIGTWMDGANIGWDLLCLDTDNGPDWLTLSTNSVIYADSRLGQLAERMGTRGVLAVWSSHRSTSFEHRLRQVFRSVLVHEVPVARGVPDIVYIAHSHDG